MGPQNATKSWPTGWTFWINYYHKILFLINLEPQDLIIKTWTILIKIVSPRLPYCIYRFIIFVILALAGIINSSHCKIYFAQQVRSLLTPLIYPCMLLLCSILYTITGVKTRNISSSDTSFMRVTGKWCQTLSYWIEACKL